MVNQTQLALITGGKTVRGCALQLTGLSIILLYYLFASQSADIYVYMEGSTNGNRQKIRQDQGCQRLLHSSVLASNLCVSHNCMNRCLSSVSAVFPSFKDEVIPRGQSGVWLFVAKSLSNKSTSDSLFEAILLPESSKVAHMEL